MKKSLIVTGILFSTLSFGFDLKQIASDVSKSIPENVTSANTTQKSNLDNSTISSGLKEALKTGVTYATSTLGKENGYLNNKIAKIPLPNNLQNVEGIVRKTGGDKIVDDLINSMNTAASKAAPRTADIFMNAISKMSLSDAHYILNGGENAATEYFKKNSSNELKTIIKPIIQDSMKENNVAQYYETANNFYQSNAKSLAQNSAVTGLAKNLGADSYITGNSNESLEDYITSKAIDGLFSMIAKKEAGIRANPIEQSTSILKQVFGK